MLGARISETATVAILGGDSVVGRVLEVLLQGLSYNTRLIDETDAGTPEELLAGVQLLLATPTVSTESRARFLGAIRSTPRTATIPVLTLSTAPQTDPADQAGLVLWPCRLEDLRMEIEAALPTAGRDNEPGDPDPCSSPEEPAAASSPADSLASTAEPRGPREDVALNGFSPHASGRPDS